MPYIICEHCGGYYKMQESESFDDFEICQCGGSLKYVESVHEIFNKKRILTCPKCGKKSEDVFCPYCGTILDAKKSSRVNKYFSFHKIEAKAPKKFFGGKDVTSTDPKDWFIRDRLRVATDCNYFRENVYSIFDHHENGGPGLNHSWNSAILIQDIISGHNNSFIRFLKTKKHILAGYLFYLIAFMILYFFWGDDGFQLSVVAVLISGMLTSFFSKTQEYHDIFFDVNILGGICILTHVLITFWALRYLVFDVPGSGLTPIRLLLILVLYWVMVNIGGLISNTIRRR